MIEAASNRGIGVYGVENNCIFGGGPSGLLFGYAGLSESAIDEGVELLAAALEELG